MDLMKKYETQDIIYTPSLHWISYVKPVLFMIIGTPFLLSIFFIKSWTIIFAILLGYLAVKGAYQYWYLKKVKIELSENYLTLKTGVLSTQINDLKLSKSESIQINQGVLGKWLDYGLLSVTTGEITHTYIIEKPMELRNCILEILKNK